MKPFILIVFAGCILISCITKDNRTNNNDEPKISTSSTTPIQQAPSKVDKTVTETPPVKAEYKSVFPKGTWKTYPQMIKTVFGEGSTKQDVQRILGYPELIEHPSLAVEVWYYGRVEVQIKNTIVQYVVNSDECPQYVFYEDLLVSSDPIERRFGARLLTGLVQSKNW